MSSAASPQRQTPTKRDSGVSKVFGALRPRTSSDSIGSSTRKSRLSATLGSLTRPKRAESASTLLPSASAPGVTPALLLQFQRAIKPTLKTHKVKGQFYPSTFNGKDLVAWIKTNVDGMENPKTALAFGMTMLREGAFEVVVGKAVAEKSSVILRLKG